MNVPKELRYSKEHEWVETLEDNKVRIGITDFAQDQLGDIVFVELPEAGQELAAEESFDSVESVKTVSELYAPVSGKVLEVNSGLEDSPENVNESPYGDGWMIVLEMSDPSELEKLLDASQYEAMVSEED